MTDLTARASSINRALDEVGDKWCLLILQVVFPGNDAFNAMMAATGVFRGVLANRLRWLQAAGCLRRESASAGTCRPRYHFTAKSLERYDSVLMAINWERRW
jgi:DNA-binding HxlR family transcriptional regulator